LKAEGNYKDLDWEGFNGDYEIIPGRVVVGESLSLKLGSGERSYRAES
jgi:hypothetical protein